MWTRIQLKERAKQSLDNNYWKVILVSLIVLLVGGGTAASVSNSVEPNAGVTIEDNDMDILDDLFSDMEPDEDYSDDGLDYSDQYQDPYASDEYWEGYYDGYFQNSRTGDSDDYLDGYSDGLLDAEAENDFGVGFEDGFSSGELGGISSAQISAFFIVFIVVFVIVLVIVSAISLVHSAFILNPIGVGAKRFFFKNLSEKAEVKEVAFAFDNNYKNIAKILFIRDLKVLLWSLLFVIPGIVKAYEYYMMPYLLAENPNLTKEETFRLSKQMMTGNKWKTFVLGLSFFWWDILSSMTLGIVGIFYVNPYKNLTYAALYEELSAINGYPARAAAAQQTYTQDTYGSYTYAQSESAQEQEQNEL